MSAALSTFWEQRNPRERQLLGMASVWTALALVWFTLLAPALQTYRVSSAAHAKLDAELAQMQIMAAEAAKLKAMPRANPAAVQTWLDGATKKLGKATATTQAGRVQISFTGASAEALAAFLAEARTAAQLAPTEAHWKKAANATTATGSALWDGNIALELAR